MVKSKQLLRRDERHPLGARSIVINHDSSAAGAIIHDEYVVIRRRTVAAGHLRLLRLRLGSAICAVGMRSLIGLENIYLLDDMLAVLRRCAVCWLG